MTRRDTFTFRTEWHDAISELPSEYRLEAMEYIVTYATTGECPESVSAVVKAIMVLIRPQIDRDRTLYENGCRGREYGSLGGRPRKPQENPNETPTEPQNNPKKTPEKPQENPNETPTEPQNNPRITPEKPQENPNETPVSSRARDNSLSIISLDNNIQDIDINNSETIERVVGDKKGGAGGKHSGKRFTKPTVEDIRSYCTERDNGVDAQRFYDFYESKGWLIGKNPMKDWKAAVRTWEQRNGRTEYTPRGQTTLPAQESVYEQNRRIKEELRRKYSGNGNTGEDTADKVMSGAGKVPGHPETGEDVGACRTSG